MTIVACTLSYNVTNERFNALIYCVGRGVFQAGDLRQSDETCVYLMSSCSGEDSRGSCEI